MLVILQSFHMIPLQLLVFWCAQAVATSPPDSRGCAGTARTRSRFLVGLAVQCDGLPVQRIGSGGHLGSNMGVPQGTNLVFIFSDPLPRPTGAPAGCAVSIRVPPVILAPRKWDCGLLLVCHIPPREALA